ncbi:MAG: nutrient deprivation-induced protein, partial [Devosia sp.]
GSDQLTRQITALFNKQPLIAGALAFAAGAALGAALPHTAQEDQLVGEQADKVRGKAAETASSLYDQGKQKAGEVYDDVRDKAGQVYGDAKDQVAELANGASTTDMTARQ